MLEKIMALFGPKTPPEFVKVLEKVGGGLHKRVDENRELLELLEKKAAPLLAECPWIVGWLKSNDEFFAALDALQKATNPQFAKRLEFPRAWPEAQVDTKPVSEMFKVVRDGQKGSHLATRTEVEDFLDACGFQPESASWEGAFAGIPIAVDGGNVRFIKQS